MKKQYVFWVLMALMMYFCVVGVSTHILLFVEYLFDHPEQTADENAVSAKSVYPYPYVMYKAPPNLNETVTFPTNRDKPVQNHIITNQNGYRYTDFDPEPKPKSIRGFVLGGSVVFLGGTNETTISGYLEQKIKQAVNDPSVPVEVINAGFLGAVSEQELALFIHEIIDYKPDFIIVFDGYNDLVHPYQSHLSVGEPVHWKQYKELILEGKNIVKHIEKRSAFSNLMSSTWFGRNVLGAPSFTDSLNRLQENDDSLPDIVKRFYNHVSTNSVRIQLSPEELEELKRYIPSYKEVSDKLISNWFKISSIAMLNNTDAICILQPCDIFPNLHEENNLYGYVRDNVIELKKSNYKLGNNITVFDEFFYAIFQEEKLFWDAVHLYDEGNEIVAELMLHKIQQHQLLSKWIEN